MVLALNKLTNITEEEKKAIIPMLGKLYITSNSNIGKIRTAIQLVVEAIDGKIANDAVSRNALHKLHLALGAYLPEKIFPMQCHDIIYALGAKGPALFLSWDSFIVHKMAMQC